MATKSHRAENAEHCKNCGAQPTVLTEYTETRDGTLTRVTEAKCADCSTFQVAEEEL